MANWSDDIAEIASAAPMPTSNTSLQSAVVPSIIPSSSEAAQPAIDVPPILPSSSESAQPAEDVPSIIPSSSEAAQPAEDVDEEDILPIVEGAVGRGARRRIPQVKPKRRNRRHRHHRNNDSNNADDYFKSNFYNNDERHHDDDDYNRQRGNSSRNVDNNRTAYSSRNSRHRDETSAQTIAVPSVHIGRIIGRGGSQLKLLQSECSVKINIGTSNGLTTDVALFGGSDSIGKCIDYIFKIVDASEAHVVQRKPKEHRQQRRFLQDSDEEDEPRHTDYAGVSYDNNFTTRYSNPTALESFAKYYTKSKHTQDLKVVFANPTQHSTQESLDTSRKNSDNENKHSQDLNVICADPTQHSTQEALDASVKDNDNVDMHTQDLKTVCANPTQHSTQEGFDTCGKDKDNENKHTQDLKVIFDNPTPHSTQEALDASVKDNDNVDMHTHDLKIVCANPTQHSTQEILDTCGKDDDNENKHTQDLKVIFDNPTPHSTQEALEASVKDNDYVDMHTQDLKIVCDNPTQHSTHEALDTSRKDNENENKHTQDLKVVCANPIQHSTQEALDSVLKHDNSNKHTQDLSVVCAKNIYNIFPCYKIQNLRFKKDFYDEDPVIQTMDPLHVAHWRKVNFNIQVHRIFGERQGLRPIPNPIVTVEHALGAFPDLVEEYQKLGYKFILSAHAQAWPILLRGEDLVFIAPPGPGKTYTYLFPVLVHIEGQISPRTERDGPLVLIMAPTRDMVTELEKEVSRFAYRQIRTVCAFGGGDRKSQIKELKKGADIVIATPGRLNDLLLGEHLNINNFSFIILDEADKILEMGFEPQLRKFIPGVNPNRQTVLTCLSWTTGIHSLAESYMMDPIELIMSPSLAPDAIKQKVEVLDVNSKNDYLMKFLKNINSKEKVLVFCGNQELADRMAKNLNANKIDCKLLPTPRYQVVRSECTETANFKILVAYEIAPRSAAVKDVTYAVNYDFPYHIQDYLCRLAKLAYTSKTKTVLSLFTTLDWAHATSFIKVLDDFDQDVPLELSKLSRSFEGSWGRRTIMGRRAYVQDVIETEDRELPNEVVVAREPEVVGENGVNGHSDDDGFDNDSGDNDVEDIGYYGLDGLIGGIGVLFGNEDDDDTPEVSAESDDLYNGEVLVVYNAVPNGEDDDFNPEH